MAPNHTINLIVYSCLDVDKKQLSRELKQNETTEIMAEDFDILNGSEDFPFPSKLSRGVFQESIHSSFDVDQFLYKYHRFTALDDANKELDELLASLNQDLLDLVNNDYNEFIKLGQSINGGLSLINNVQIELKGFQSKLTATQKELSESSDLTSRALNTKKELQNIRIRAKLSLLLHNHVNDFESLLENNVVYDEKEEILVGHLRSLTSYYLSIHKVYGMLEPKKKQDGEDSSADVKFIINLYPKIMSLRFEFKSFLDEIVRIQKNRVDRDSNLMLQLMNIYRIISSESEFLGLLKEM